MKESTQAEGSGMQIVVLVTRWNEFVTKQLLEGAVSELEGHHVAVIWVPGAWEIPIAARKVSFSETPPDGIVALGCILQGETPHAAQLATDVSGALMGLQMETGIPISWGVLTPNTPEQALDRSGLKHGNKGREAARAALTMAQMLKDL
jgi:6,7-dimethyl-8-ribityllumazine synthase